MPDHERTIFIFEVHPSSLYIKLKGSFNFHIANEIIASHKRKLKFQTLSRMELKAVLVRNASLRRGFIRFFACLSYQKKSATSHVLEAMVSKANGSGGVGVVSCEKEDGGVVRMKILVKKSDLKLLVEAMSGDVNGVAHRPTMMSSVNVPSSTAEQRLNHLLLKKHLSRAKPLKDNSHQCWSPALQSIPEEF